MVTLLEALGERLLRQGNDPMRLDDVGNLTAIP
jgi:hypothetical protein